MQITVLFDSSSRNIILIIFLSVYLITYNFLLKPDDKLIIKETTTATAAATSLNKRINGRTMAAHVRYNSWYISLPSSAKQEREMTKFCVL